MEAGYEFIIARYEDYLLGKKKFTMKAVRAYLEKVDDDVDAKAREEKRIMEEKEGYALAILRYAIIDLLGWTPQDAMEFLDGTIIKQLKLDRILAYVHYPKDLDRSKDYDWAVHLAFPNDTIYDVTDRVLQMYRRILNGKPKRFPKRMFEGDNAAEKLAILLNDYVSRNLAVRSISELYEIFGNQARGNVLMHEGRLYDAYRNLYATPLDYLHFSLESNSDDFLYGYYRYVQIVQDISKEARKIR